MKSIEQVIDNIVDEHKECRWMDASELRGYLEVVAREQKAIDEKEMFAEREKAFNNGYEVAKKELIEKACKVFKDFMWIQYGDRIDESMAMYWKESITKAMEE